jgi:hypothetical protein
MNLAPRFNDQHAEAIALRGEISILLRALAVEPPIFDRDLAKVLERDEPWYEQRLRVLEDSIRKRLGDLPVALAMPLARWRVQRR